MIARAARNSVPGVAIGGAGTPGRLVAFALPGKK